jgi:HK97 family phage prohead protease
MRHVHKTFPAAHVKALAADAAPGTFEAVVACFGNVDLADEVIERGAFEASLAEGLPPIVWSHDWLTPPIGVCLGASETDEGLLVRGQLFVGDGDDHPRAREVYTAMRAADGNGVAPLREWSVGLTVKRERFEDRDGRKVVVLEELGLLECGPCLRGVNPATRTVGVKGADCPGCVERRLRSLYATATPTPPTGADDADARGRVAGVLLPDPY